MTTVRQLPSPSFINAPIQTPNALTGRPRSRTLEYVAPPAAKRQRIASHQDRAAALTTPVVQVPVAQASQVIAPVFDPSVIETLNNGSLQALRAAHIEIPEYDRAKLQPGFVHFGVGNFFSAHLAVYLHELMNQGEGSEWGILGVGMTPSSVAKQKKILAQDSLHTVVERDATGEKPRVIGSMTSYVVASEDPASLIDQLASASTRIVSMTLTGSGYYYDEKTGKLDTGHVDIAHDLHNTTAPKTVYGYLAAALAKRQAAGLPPFTVLSCDNLPKNGDRTRDMLVSFIAQTDPALANWVREEGAFPNTMVDRITPAASPEDVDTLLRRFGIRDAWPAFTETFTQFVIEDKFSAGRPALEKVGVQFVKDVEPYAQMKQRLLNANHSAIAYKGVLAGYQFVHQAMGNATFANYIRMLMDSELPVLPPVPGIDLAKYCDALMERFHNPALGDEVLRLCRRGSEKIPKFVLASIRDRLASHVDVRLSSLVVAAFIRYLSGKDEQGQAFKVEDPRAVHLQQVAQETGDDAEAFLRQSGIVSDDLLANTTFVQEVAQAYASLGTLGTQATLEAYVAEAQGALSNAA